VEGVMHSEREIVENSAENLTVAVKTKEEG
jgi:hypothetical protein